jgi:hypothetical protein
MQKRCAKRNNLAKNLSSKLKSLCVFPSIDTYSKQNMTKNMHSNVFLLAKSCYFGSMLNIYKTVDFLLKFVDILVKI